MRIGGVGFSLTGGGVCAWGVGEGVLGCMVAGEVVFLGSLLDLSEDGLRGSVFGGLGRVGIHCSGCLGEWDLGVSASAG